MSAKGGVNLFFKIYICTYTKFPLKWKYFPSLKDLFFLVTSNIFLSACCVSSISGLRFSGHVHLPAFNSSLRVWFWQTDSWHVLGTQGVSVGNRLSNKICSTLIKFRSEEKQQKSMARGLWQLRREPELQATAAQKSLN